MNLDEEDIDFENDDDPLFSLSDTFSRGQSNSFNI